MFCNIPTKGLKFGREWEDICDKILHERETTVIEVTQQCKLRCKYCTFGRVFTNYRTHSSKIMDDQTLIQTVESALSYSDKLNEISIGFYGGEPLCGFEQIKKAVIFAKEKDSSKRIRYSLTTNATLMNKDKASFLRNDSFVRKKRVVNAIIKNICNDK